MLPKSERPHFSRTNLKQKEKIDRGKQKLFLFNIKRICYKRISAYLQDFKTVLQQQANIINSAFRRVDRNLQFCKIMAWKKIAFYGKLKQRQNHLIKFVIISSLKYEKHSLSHSFRCISNFTNRKTTKNINKLLAAKTVIVKNIVAKHYKKLLLYSFTKIKLKAIKKFNQLSTCKLFAKIVKGIIKERKYYAWSRMLGVPSLQHEDVQHELGQLTKERDSLRKQLSKKNKQMQELQNQIMYKNEEIVSYNTIRSDSRQRNNSLENSRRSFKSIGSNKRGSSKDLSQKRSQVGSFEQNTSILSWLNGSFMSIKSGKSNKSKSINGFECYCKYRQKYTQYKAEAVSLKNQLQIIKSELEVTKDLNQHLQFEISNLCVNQNTQSPQLQLLRKQVKQLRKQKQIARDKMLKSQKYIANLKYEFKMKIENLYRNLKKANN